MVRCAERELIMAKSHDFNTVKMWIGDKEIPVTNGMRIRYSLGYSVKHTGDAVSTDYFHKFDISTTVLRICEMAKNSFTIKWANDQIRPLTHENAGRLYPRGDVITYEKIFPGKGGPKPINESAIINHVSGMNDEEKEALIAKIMAS